MSAVAGAGGRRPVGRAGRDLPAAIAVGLALAGLVVVTLFTVKVVWIGVVAGAVAIGTFEVVRALRTIGADLPLPPLVAGAAAMPFAAYAGGADALVLALAVTVLAALAWRLAGSAAGLLRDLAAAGFASTYVGFLAGFAALLTSPADGPRRVLTFIGTVVVSDVGGYTAGVLSGGRHKIAPSVSPGKSWEGFGGSALACVLMGVGCVAGLLHQAVWQGVVFGLAMACAATLGDLGESMLKRDIGIKDMGTLLPGHGGIMDRLDSLLYAAPVAYLLITAFAPTR